MLGNAPMYFRHVTNGTDEDHRGYRTCPRPQFVNGRVSTQLWVCLDPRGHHFKRHTIHPHQEEPRSRLFYRAENCWESKEAETWQQYHVQAWLTWLPVIKTKKCSTNLQQLSGFPWHRKIWSPSWQTSCILKSRWDFWPPRDPFEKALCQLWYPPGKSCEWKTKAELGPKCQKVATIFLLPSLHVSSVWPVD